MEDKNYADPAGELKYARNANYKYFLPKTPPTSIKYDDETANLLSEAERKLGKLSGTGFLLPNPHLLIDPYIKKEAVLSSKIEGTQASLSDMFKLEAGKKEKESGDIKEVSNYVKALEYGLNEIESKDIDLSLIKEMHKILLSGVRGRERNPGQFRENQNWIGTKGTNIDEATYIPPAPEELTVALKKYIDYLNVNNIPLLVQASLMHYYFEAIHPFRDGDGRIGRLLITLFLCKREGISQPLLYLSAFFHKNREEYYKKLLEVSQKSAYLPWIKFFLKGVIEQSEDALSRAKKLSKLREKYLDTIHKEDLVQNTARVTDKLFQNPFTTIPKVKEDLEISYPTAKRYIQSLEDLGIVKEVTNQKRYKTYVAQEILEILESV